MKKYIIALDQGTTSSRAIIFDREKNIIATAQKEVPLIYPHDGWVEQDATEIYATQYSVMMEALAKSGIEPHEISAIGIANQRETTVVWDRLTGLPVYNAIVWQCRRTAEIITDLCERGLSDYIRETTGLVPDAYFSASKISWILSNIENGHARAQNGELLFGTVETWLIWKLTGGKVHATDYSNASRTMIYDIHNLRWDERLLSELNIPRAMLPEVLPSSHEYGTVSIGTEEVPISGVAGDQQAALFGQNCFERGDAKVTYGTGCFMLMNTGDSAISSRHGLVTTLCASLDNRPQYALEGSVFVGGAVIQWLQDGLRFFSESREVEEHARQVSDTGGVYLVPAFTGLGSPYWDMYARGLIIGITRDTTREHIIRAAEESIAYQTFELLEAMVRDTGSDVESIRVDGGAARDNFLMQFQADIMNAAIIRPQITESTALGAAFLAGLGSGFWHDKSELFPPADSFTRFTPAVDSHTRTRLIDGWKKAAGRSLNWLDK